ncbi:MAG: serine hydrolase [Tistlia sp.]|uniref:serine hydrolase domain-containing protein n=1 Tax=Tistlia sp. TaxID=3057121 RepID=UPI0034A1B4FC
MSAPALGPGRRTVLAGLAAGAAGLMLRPGGAAGAGFDRAGLDRAVERARRLEQLHSLIVARDGEIAFAEAFRGPGLDALANVKSVAKTVVAALTGIAIDRGVLAGTDQPVAPLLADSLPADPDPRLQALTVDHLLTMRAGLERTSGPNYGGWIASRDWVRDALDRPFVDRPGGRMLYSTGSYHLLSAVLSEASGESLLALARSWLGEPLGIEIPPWTRDPQGRYLGGNNMALSPRALFRFGELYRRGGLWEGERVISRSWIEQSWRPRTHSPFSGDDYGYGWFVSEARGHPLFYARGYGGQLLYLVPALGLTVVVTSDATRPARSEGYFGALKALLAEAIVPAAEAA